MSAFACPTLAKKLGSGRSAVLGGYVELDQVNNASIFREVKEVVFAICESVSFAAQQA